MWTFTGYCTFFLPFCCKLSESLTHHGSRFLEGEAENCRKPAFRCESGAGPNMQWHGTTWLRFWMVQTHDSQRNRVWPESPLCAISIHSIHVSVLISLPDSSLPAPSSKSEQSTSITVSEQGGLQVHSILRRTMSKDCWKNLQRIHLQSQKQRWAECRFACCTIVFSWTTNS